jgi:glucose/mannose transport system permease protein
MWIATFRGNDYAHGAAIGILLLLSVAVLVVPYLVWSLRREAEL